MDYTPTHFDLEHLGGNRVLGTDNVHYAWREGEAPASYLFSALSRLAVNVALATGRPLLISGEPGSGKTTLGMAVARALGWRYYKHTVTSRTQATDLLWTFDALGRLNDATTPGLSVKSAQHYVEPGAVWWGFDPDSAANRGTAAIEPAGAKARDPGGHKPGGPAVVLVDEIDKADPDVPNDLLEPFDIRQFTVRETQQRIEARRPVFLVLTTNGERELPPAFLRRCVLLALEEPDAGWFEQVAERRFPDGYLELHRRLAATVMDLRGEAGRAGLRKPSTAEFIDALNVCRQLRVDEKSEIWRRIVDSVLLKSDRPGPGAHAG